MKPIQDNLQFITNQIKLINSQSRIEPEPPKIEPKPPIIEVAIKKLPITLSPILQHNEYVHNKDWLAAKCINGHIHKYYFMDIIKDNIKQCTTCNSGTMFIKNTRLLIEECLSIPIALKTDSTERVYWNPIYKLKIIYPLGKGGTNRIEKKDDYLILYVYHGSMKSAIQTICTALRQLPNVTIEQHNQIDNLQSMAARSKLVMSSALTSVIYGKGNDIENQELYLENC